MKLKNIILSVVCLFCFAQVEAQVISEKLFADTTQKGDGQIFHQFKVSNGIVIMGRVLEKEGYMNGVTKLDTAGNVLWKVLFPDSIAGIGDPRYFGNTANKTYSYDFSTPVLDKNEDLFFFTSKGGDSSFVNCIKLNTRIGAKIWEQRVAKRYSYFPEGSVFLLDNSDSTFLLERKGEANLNVARLAILKKTNGEIIPIKTGLTNLSLFYPALLVDKTRKVYYYTAEYKLFKLELVNDSFRILWTKDYTNNNIGTIGNAYVDSLGRGYIRSYYGGALGVSPLYQLLRFDVNNGNILKSFPVKSVGGVTHIKETTSAMYFFGFDRINSYDVQNIIKFDKLADSITWNKPYYYTLDQERTNSIDIDTQGFIYTTGRRTDSTALTNYTPGYWIIYKINSLDGSIVYKKFVTLDSTIKHQYSQGKGIYCFGNKVLMVGELQQDRQKIDDFAPFSNFTILNMTFIQFNPENGNLLKVKPLEGYYQDSSKIEQILMTSDRVIVVRNLGLSIQLESYNLDKRLMWKRIFIYGHYPIAVVSPTGNIGLIMTEVTKGREQLNLGGQYKRALTLDKNGKILWQTRTSGLFNVILRTFQVDNSKLYFNDADTSIIVVDIRSDYSGNFYKFKSDGGIVLKGEGLDVINPHQDSVSSKYLRVYKKNYVNIGNLCFFNMSTLTFENCLSDPKLVPYNTTRLPLKANIAFEALCENDNKYLVFNTKTGDTLWIKRFPITSPLQYCENTTALKLAADNEQKYVYALNRRMDSVFVYKFNLQNGDIVHQKLVFIGNKNFEIKDFVVSPSNNRLIITGNVPATQYGGTYNNGFIRVIDSSCQVISQELLKGEEKGDNSLGSGVGFFSDSTFWVGGKVSKIVQGKAAVIYESKLSNQLKTVTGKVYLDLNGNNSIDSTDIALPNAVISSKQSRNFTITDTSGYYTMYFDSTAQDTILANVDIRNAVINPKSYPINSRDSLKNFAVTLPTNTQDLRISLTEITPLRSGFANFYYLNYKNVGSKVMSGRVRFFEPSVLSTISAAPIPFLRDSLSIYWDFNNLKPNEERVLTIFCTVRRGVANGSKFNAITSIDPINSDIFKKDNVDTLNQIVVGSYDPNDKQVTYNGSKTPPSVIDASTELIYTIRFQNTGTYRADFVKVIDTLSDKLDLATFRVLASSHPYTVSLPTKNVLSFDFNPIYLPDSTSNEKGSHGFIKFAIKPKKALTAADLIKNTGHIYFDYNPAIITNTVESANPKPNSIFTPSVSADKLAIFPNPAENIIKIEVEDTEFKEGNLSIYDLSGRLLLTKFIANKTSLVNVNHLNAGEYICTLKSSDNKVFVNKFVKL
jgi:hypothetical protein